MKIATSEKEYTLLFVCRTAPIFIILHGIMNYIVNIPKIFDTNFAHLSNAELLGGAGWCEKNGTYACRSFHGKGGCFSTEGLAHAFQNS